MLHWGRDGHYLKYRCPEKAGLFCCLKQHEAVSRCSTSDYGLVVILSYSSPRSHPQSPLLLPFSLLSKRLLPSYPSFSPIEYSKIVGEPKPAKARRQADLTPLHRRVLAPLAGAPIGRQAAGRRMLKGNRLSLHDHRWHRSEAKEYHPGFQRADRRLGLRKTRFLELRHSCATIPADQAVDVKVVSRLLGHRKINVTFQFYQHIPSTMQEEAARAMERLFRVA